MVAEVCGEVTSEDCSIFLLNCMYLVLWKDLYLGFQMPCKNACIFSFLYDCVLDLLRFS